MHLYRPTTLEIQVAQFSQSCHILLPGHALNMSANLKNLPTADLDKVAAQLAEIKITPVAVEDHIELRATAKFAIKNFDAGEYEVYVGLTEALLRLEHPAFDATDEYEAKIEKERFSESLKKNAASDGSAEGEVSFGWKFLSAFGLKGKATGSKKFARTSEEHAVAEYAIIVAQPGQTWRIGSELGDPRQASGAKPDAVANCLDRKYLSGSDGEIASNRRGPHPTPFLCRLDAKTENPALANDQRITASLYRAPGSLRVAIRRRDAMIPAKDKSKDTEVEQKLREALIQVCLERATKTRGTGRENQLSGEFPLHHCETLAPNTRSPRHLSTPARRARSRYE